MGRTELEEKQDEAALEIAMRRQESIIKTLIVSGAFEVRGGSVTLHFDAKGDLRKVDSFLTLFRS